MVQATVVGARGYLGRELVRLLLSHPDVGGIVPVSRSGAGPIAAHVPQLRGTELALVSEDDDSALDADVLFLATPKGAAAAWTERAEEAGMRCVIDLSRDHRLDGIGGGSWHYGLADVDPPAPGTRRVANPGCYPTASLLGMLPLLRSGHTVDGPVIVDGKSGSSGAGATPGPGLHFPAANEATRAYKVLGHDHGDEIGARAGRRVRFTPHIVPQTRGLLTTCYVPLEPGVGTSEARGWLHDAYDDAPFVQVVDEPDTRHVHGSNQAHVAVDVDETGLAVVRCAVDNLLKGGAGQAVQNMNHILGHDATAGLPAVGVV